MNLTCGAVETHSAKLLIAPALANLRAFPLSHLLMGSCGHTRL